MAQNFQPIPIGARTYQSRSKFAYGERLVNWYAKSVPEEGGKGPLICYPTPGLKPWTTIGNGPIRGMIRLGNDLYVVSGTEVYAITSAKVATLVGTAMGTRPVSMTKNRDHIAVCTDDEAYAINRTTATVLSQTTLRGATYRDGYGIFVKRGTQKLYITGLDDMTSINALDFTTKDALPDNVVSCLVDHGDVWVFGEESTEVLYNSGNPSFPFERVANGVIERGCLAPGSVAKTKNAVLWLGDDKKVYGAKGYEPQEISSEAINRLIEESSHPEDAQGYTYTQDGTTFYALNMPGLSLAYDTDEQRWHERVSPTESRWRTQGHASAFGKLLWGDFESNAIYELDLDTYTDNSAAIRREMVFPTINGNGHRVLFSQLKVDFQPGVGLTSGQGSDPKAMLDWSDDGQKTWSQERTCGIGAIGKYNAQCLFNALGGAYQRNFRLAVSDPVNAVVCGAYLKSEMAL